MSSTSSRRGAAIVLGGLLAACTTQPAPRYARPALPLPDSVRARYEVPGPVRLHELVPAGRREGMRSFRGVLSAGREETGFHLIRPAGNAPLHPFVVTLPILGGGRSLMWILGWELARRGYAVGWTERVGSAMRPGQEPATLEAMLRRTVVRNRMLVRWARGRDWIDADRVACIGISMGGMIAGVLLAVEPTLQAGALCLAGGDLPDLMLRSTEGRVRRWRDWKRTTDGIAGRELRRQLEVWIHSDPALLGPYVPTEKVIMVGGKLDEVVPAANQDLLWESLGRPRRLLLPLAHYSSALALSPILNTVDKFVRRRFRDARSRLAAR